VDPFLIDSTAYAPVKALCEALGYYVQWDAATKTVVITSEPPATTPAQPAANALMAGAGVGEIIFPQEMFPVEGFSGEVNDTIHARVLVISNGVKIAIVSLEMVNIPEDLVEICKQVVSEKTGTPKNNVWVHATHAITTPHAPSDAAARELYAASITDAITTAAQQAADTYRPAVMGIGAGTSDVNANRDIELNGEWYYGLGSTMTSNKTMTILRFNALDGKPIGFFVSYGIKPTSIDNVEMSKNTRKLSADVPGVACTLLEKEFGAPAMFCMPAAGDQIPKEISYYYDLNEKGEAALVEKTVKEAVAVMERQGIVMGNDAIKIAKGITCNDTDPTIATSTTSFTWENKAGDGEVEIIVEGLRIGDDIAFAGLKPETNAVTELDLWKASPFKHTLIVSFLNGDQKYMPDANAYKLDTWEAKRAGTAAGCAEEFVNVATKLLNDLKAGKISADKSSDPTTDGKKGDGTTAKIEFGGYKWTVLEVKDGKTLVMSDEVLGQRAYHAAGGAVTWENCELRSYLNGEFYNKTFTDKEKTRIAETTVTNASNSKYGIRGGNDTKDKVFLLSLNEAETYLFGFTDLLRAKDIKTGEYVWWHLRSPGEALDVAACVSSTGLIDYHGVTDGVTDPTGGVRPAMWLNLE
jgi:hypothetical protein